MHAFISIHFPLGKFGNLRCRGASGTDSLGFSNGIIERLYTSENAANDA